MRGELFQKRIRMRIALLRLRFRLMSRLCRANNRHDASHLGLHEAALDAKTAIGIDRKNRSRSDFLLGTPVQPGLRKLVDLAREPLQLLSDPFRRIVAVLFGERIIGRSELVKLCLRLRWERIHGWTDASSRSFADL